eukprot:1187217-Prorocentrum_minimum.AAC.1
MRSPFARNQPPTPACIEPLSLLGWITLRDLGARSWNADLIDIVRRALLRFPTAANFRPRDSVEARCDRRAARAARESVRDVQEAPDVHAIEERIASMVV